MKKIIVPSDFTSVADSAIHYAIQINKVLQYQIVLLNIAKDDGDVADANEKLKAQVAKFKNKHNVDLEAMVRVGNIFDHIPQVAKEENAELVVMGTHGLRGLMQFIVGGNALRIINDSAMPIIITQSDTQTEKISKILVPLDLHKETKQTLTVAKDVAARFNAEVHIVSPDEKDEFLRNRIVRNIHYAEGYLEEHGLKYKTTMLESGIGFTKEVIKYAKYNGIDLICILNTSDEQLIHAFGIDSEQKMITNDADIPVMVINGVTTLLDSRTIFAQ